MKSLAQRLIPLQDEYNLLFIKLNSYTMQYIIKQYKIGRDEFTIYAYHDKQAPVRKFRHISRKMIQGCFTFANRVTSGNGFLVHDQQGFNSVTGAKANLKALKRIMAKHP